ncbi:NADP-dependent oxidoreductase [Dactylosporangium sp. CA-233914]|uniref:NADP-dependent oxidoreductase n=1 Tax=Dactylosporangium sp. CA-233914 TaxID=3239934 RepID=UPI003D918BD2
MTIRVRQIILRRVPQGVPVADDVEIVQVDLPTPADGQLLVQNRWLSIEPAVRIRMGGSASSIPKLPNYEIGAPLEGAAIGEVVESNVDGFEKGDMVVHSQGWREAAIIDPANPAHRVYQIPRGENIPSEAYLGLLGLQGFTAYAGLFHVANLKEGDVVWVSAAAGAVGNLVAQIAKLNGHRVIASAGSADKVAWLKDTIGVDAAFDYHDGDLVELLEKAAPAGIDVYFDNVGGEHLAAALEVLRPGGRVALCGLISTYNATEPVPGPSNMFSVIAKNLTIKGFLAVQYAEHLETYRDQARQWIAEDRVQYRENIVQGLDAAPDALVDVLTGRNTGKMLVDLR